MPSDFILALKNSCDINAKLLHAKHLQIGAKIENMYIWCLLEFMGQKQRLLLNDDSKLYYYKL